MSKFLGQFPSYSQLPAIDNSSVFPSDSAYTLDDGGYWIAKVPTAPPGALAQWLFIDTLRGPPGSTGPAGVGLPGPQGQIGPPGRNGSTGPMGPAGKTSFSYLSLAFRVPDPSSGLPVLTPVSDTSWMTPGLLVFIPGAGTFTVIGSPPSANTVNLVNSGDPNNAPTGTMVAAGTLISPANVRGPSGPQGPVGPSGPPGPQGVSGSSVFSTLKQTFSIPSTSGVAFVQDASPFAVGQIVYVENGDYFSVQNVDDIANALTLVNQNYPGGVPAGTVIPVGNTVSGTGPQGPQGAQGIQGPQGPQGIQGVAMTGTIAMWPAVSPPGGWLICDGSAVSRTQFPGLFAIISTTFGAGDGSSTFNLPDMRGVFPIGANATYPLASAGGEATHLLIAAEMPSHTHSVGDHTHVGANHNHNMDHYHLIPANQFNHLHSYNNGAGVQIPSGGGLLAGSSSGVFVNQVQNTSTYAQPQGSTNYASQTSGSWVNTGFSNQDLTTSAAGGGATTSAGNDTAHNNLPPYRALNFIIKG